MPASWRRWPRATNPTRPSKCSSALRVWARRRRSRRSRRRNVPRQGQRLGLLAADGFRVGAIEQLRLYADILGSPFGRHERRRVRSRARRASGVRCWSTPRAARPSDDVSKDMFRVLGTRSDVRTHLVIPATTSREDGRADVRSLRRCASVTRRAHAPRRGRDRSGRSSACCASAACRCRIFGTGQNVPADLQRATAPVLADWVMGEMAQGAVA